MKIIKGFGKTDEIVEALKKGGLVVYPTETLYGIGVDATNDSAVGKLNKYKQRPFGKPYSIAVSDKKMAEEYVHINKTAEELYGKFLPGPLTIISKGKHKVAPGVESESGTLGVRIPDYPKILNIIRKLGRPITSTSANASYKKRPYKISDILKNIGGKQKSLIDLIIDAGELPKNEPSTVIDTTMDDAVTLRQGEIKLKNRNEVVSRSEEATQNTAKELWQKYESYKGKRAIVFALIGKMGSGKTQWTKGLARAMGITDIVTSPTFAIENEYQTKGNKLFHFDAWRLEDSSELTALGFENLIKEKEVLSIEWAEKVEHVIRKHDENAVVVWVNIEYGKKENERIISWGNI